MTDPVACLIPAAGLGRRFAASRAHSGSKIELPLAGKTLLEKTLEPFLAARSVREIIVAVPPGQLTPLKKALGPLDPGRIRVVAGGASRTESVSNALSRVSGPIRWIIVHDGARPLLRPEVLRAFLSELRRRKALILARPVYPTLKTGVKNVIRKTVSREGLWEAETPQGFRKDILKRGYREYRKKPFPATDEASLVEHLGVPVYLFKSMEPNLKITEYSDYVMAKRFLEYSKEQRVGIGYDIHRLVAGRALWLGGIRIPSKKGPLGHSDGDPVLHALSDALLGALGLGDIGDYFPDTSLRTKGMKSARILFEVCARIRRAGYALGNADINLLLERPKIAPYKGKMRERISEIMGVPAGRISIKARTAEGLGAVGAGAAVAACAIVRVEKIDE